MPVQFTLDFEKVLAALSYFGAQDLPELTKGKLCKLIFLADRAHVLRYSRPITGDVMTAMQHGPVPSYTKNVLDRFESGIADSETASLGQYFKLDRNYQYPRYAFVSMADLSSLSKSDLKVLKDVVRDYGEKTFTELRALTHEFSAWKVAWDTRTTGSNTMLYENLFAEEDASDAISGAMEEMIENGRIKGVCAE